MQRYREQGSRELIELRCNCCGSSLRVEQGIVKEGCVHFRVPFGFFSQKDGQTQEFDLCEACYDKITAGFVIPATTTERTELL